MQLRISHAKLSISSQCAWLLQCTSVHVVTKIVGIGVRYEITLLRLRLGNIPSVFNQPFDNLEFPYQNETYVVMS